MSSNGTEVLVVGAGPTGLTAAAQLLSQGVACRIIEKEPKINPSSRAVAIQARTLEMLDIMGIAEKFVKRGTRLKAFNVYNETSHLVHMSFTELPSRYPFVLSLPQRDTEEVLTEHLQSLGGKVERESSLAHLEQTPDHVVVRIKGADGKEEEAQYSWVIGCDGAHSSVGEMLGASFSGKKFPEYYVLVDVDYLTTLDPQELYLFSLGKHIAGFHPFSSTSARVFADADKGDKEPTLAQIQKLLDKRGPGLVKLTNLNWLSMHEVHLRQVDEYRHGRVFLAGDAAHVNSPASGQGMNLGIQDAFNLAWKLSRVTNRQASDALLNSYSAERKAVGKEIVAMTDILTRINSMPMAVAQKVRTVVGPMIAKNTFVQQNYREAVTQIAQNYRSSPIVSDHFSKREGPAAGDRAPESTFVQADSTDTKRLLEILRDNKHHLLIFIGPNPNVAALHSAEDIQNRLAYRYEQTLKCHFVFDSVGSLPDANWAANSLLYSNSTDDGFPTDCGSLFLIRPDGYIGFRGNADSHNELLKHLQQILIPQT